MKSRILIDIKKTRPVNSTQLSYGARGMNPRLNLSSRRVISIPVKFLLTVFFIPLIILSFIFGSAVAPAPTSSGVMAAQNDDERQALQSQLEQYENQIFQIENTIEEYKKQGASLQGEIKKLEAQISKINTQIKAVNLTLSKLDEEINSTQSQINQTEDGIALNKKNLASTLQAVYENDSKNLIEILFKNPELSDFFTDLNNLLAVQDNLRLLVQKIAEAHQKLVDQKEVLALERVDAAALKAYQDSQRTNIRKTQTEKNSLLKVTKGKESEYQKLLTETKKTAAEIRKQIFKLLGGGELEFEEAYQLAKMAEKSTGIRASLILAVLDRESALGKNVGQCYYKTAMHPTRDIPIFLGIIAELGMEKDLESGIIKVSCAISSDGAYGGAMGPAQFIPSTWKIYKDRVSEITGNHPASPWRNTDAFVATALYLKDAYNSSACVNYGNQYSNILPKQVLQERCAAAKYYAGSRWFTYRFVYGDKVISLAQQFEDDIAILTS